MFTKINYPGEEQAFSCFVATLSQNTLAKKTPDNINEGCSSKRSLRAHSPYKVCVDIHTPQVTYIKAICFLPHRKIQRI